MDGRGGRPVQFKWSAIGKWKTCAIVIEQNRKWRSLFRSLFLGWATIKKKWLEFKYKPNGCNVFMHATFSCRSYWQLSYGSLKLTSRNTIITPKGLWVLIRCFLRSFHNYAHNFFFNTQGKKNIFITFHEKWFVSWGQVDDHLGYNMKPANPHTTRKALSFVFTEVLLRQMCENF